MSAQVRGVLSVLASIVPAKLRMFVGLAALTLLIWIPVVWWMAKTITTNDRVRALTEVELHHLVEATHAAGGESHGESKDAKKDAGHGGKDEKKKDAKKSGKEEKAGGDHAAKDDHAAKKPEKKAEKKQEKKAEGHGGGH